TQKDLNEGLVNYTHNGRHVDSTLTDSFYFSYHDSVVTAPKNGTFKIAIAPYCSSKNFSSDHKKFGQGTFSNPYKICFAEQMNQIGLVSTDWSFHYELKADISLAAYTGTSYRIIGRSPTPFTGTFEGNNKTISNFTYSTIN
ncbi:MAG: hypothetical protein NTV34_02145, partial [Proteobacteria bacterium]|nr:hypothetical protein [Pseudomonadota bacterium]